MTVSFSFAGQYGPEDLRAQDAGSKLLVVPVSATVYLPGTTTLAVLYTDRTKTVVAANPVANSATRNTAGLDVGGNLLFFADPGRYDVLFGGITYTVSVYPDVADLVALLTAAGAPPLNF